MIAAATRRAYLALLGLPALLALAAGASDRAFGDPGETLAEATRWHAPSAETVRSQVVAWLDERLADEAVRARAAEIWSADPAPATPAERLARLAQTIALADENARKLVALCAGPRTELSPPEAAWLREADTPPLVANNLRLLYGRWLVHESLYDEALAQLEGLRLDDVVDPAALLFYRGVIHHRLLNREAGLEAIESLLAGAEESPRRYAAIAPLMQADLKNLEVDSLDHIARRMDDVRRRLDLGRAGPKVREIEDGVIESLDKLIKRLEDQQQQQAAASAGAAPQPSRPAQDSVPAGGKGRGEVTKRDVGSESGWGNLPPKQREEALQQIGREFPTHYRDVIEQYFRKLATEGSP